MRKSHLNRRTDLREDSFGFQFKARIHGRKNRRYPNCLDPGRKYALRRRDERTSIERDDWPTVEFVTAAYEERSTFDETPQVVGPIVEGFDGGAGRKTDPNRSDLREIAPFD